MLELARPADRKTVNVMAKQVHAMHVAWRPDIYEMVDELYPLERFQQAVANRELFVARIGDQVVGYVNLRVREQKVPGLVYRKVMVLDEICVADGLRDQGIGTQMVSEVKVLAKAFRCTDLQLSVYPQNDEAVSFYQKCGFMIRNINMDMKL